MNYLVNLPQASSFTSPSPRGQFNADMAKAHAGADMRFNMKPFDKPGMSRGGGQQYMAGIGSAQNFANAVAQAYANQMESAASKADRALSDVSAQENFGLGVAGIDQQNTYANALNALQRQQAIRANTQSALGGLLGNLDSFLGF